MNGYKIMQDAIDTFGVGCQIDKAIEEMAELTKALLKIRYGGKNKYEEEILREAVDEEMGDVAIMLEQLYMIFDNRGRVSNYQSKKLERLEWRIKKARERT